MGIRGKRPLSSWQWKQRNTIGTTSPCMAPRLLSASKLKSIQSYKWRHNKWSMSSVRTGPHMLGWQCPARRSGRLSDSRVYQTNGIRESRKDGRSSKYLAKLHTPWDRLLQFIHPLRYVEFSSSSPRYPLSDWLLPVLGTVDTGKGWKSQVCPRAIGGITTCHTMRHSLFPPPPHIHIHLYGRASTFSS